MRIKRSGHSSLHAALLVCILAVCPYNLPAQTRDTLSIQQLLRRLHAQNAYVRVSDASNRLEGRVTALRDDRIDIRGEALDAARIQSIEQRLVIGDSGFGRGFRTAFIAGLVLSIPFRMYGESEGGPCEWRCTLALHGIFPASLGLTGGMIGDLRKPNRYGWTKIWPQ